jgi:hypothetical protein
MRVSAHRSKPRKKQTGCDPLPNASNCSSSSFPSVLASFASNRQALEVLRDCAEVLVVWLRVDVVDCAEVLVVGLVVDVSVDVVDCAVVLLVGLVVDVVDGAEELVMDVVPDGAEVLVVVLPVVEVVDGVEELVMDVVDGAEELVVLVVGVVRDCAEVLVVLLLSVLLAAAVPSVGSWGGGGGNKQPQWVSNAATKLCNKGAKKTHRQSPRATTA